MRNLRKFTALLLAIPLLLGCNLTTLLGAGPSSSVPTAASSNTVQAGANIPQLEGQVRQVVTNFFKSLQSDPSGESAKAFLAPALLDQLPQGVSVGTLVGLQDKMPDFSLSAVTFNPDAKQATLDATVLYTQPANVRFHLVQSGGDWKIDQINLQSGEAGYPSTPEEVVQTFLTSYQESPDNMSRFLSSNRLAQLPPGGAVGMLNIQGALEGMMIESAAVNPNPPSAAVTVTIQSGGKGSTRVFSLTQENGQWKIDNIDMP